MRENNESDRRHIFGNPRIVKHVIGQAVAPFVGRIVSTVNSSEVADTAQNVQWATSALIAVVLIELQHRVFHGLEEKIGKLRSSVAAVLVPSTVTTGVSYIAHSAADTNAEGAAVVVGILSVLGYSSLQCYQLLSSKTDNRNDSDL